MRKHFPIILLFFIMAVLILDRATVLSAANNGIHMCLQTVIPILFPYLFITPLLISHLSGTKLPFLSLIGRFMKIPPNAEMIWLIGLFGGYPAGAQCINQALNCGSISEADGKRLLGFCNNAGPSFIFGLGMYILLDLRLCFLIWLIQILSSIITGALMPGSSISKAIPQKKTRMPVTIALKNAIYSIAMICGWVLLFKISMELLEKWILWIFPQNVNILLCGMLELTNGCMKLLTIQSMPLRFLFFSVFLSFGGFCVAMQTMAISTIDHHLYLPAKALQSTASILLSTIICLFMEFSLFLSILAIFSGGILTIYLIYTRKNLKKGVEIKKRILYNPIKLHTR